MTATVQSIIGFLEQRASTTQLTGQQVTSLIVDLKAQINQLSVTVTNAEAGAVTLLYSGQMGNGVHTGTVVDALANANPGKIITINQTEVYTLLDKENLAFHNALKAALGPDSDAVYKSLIEGSIVNGTRVPDSLWDDASRRFAQNATGDINIIAPEGNAFKIFAQTELPALLGNPNVTHIDGIPRAG